MPSEWEGIDSARRSLIKLTAAGGLAGLAGCTGGGGGDGGQSPTESGDGGTDSDGSDGIGFPQPDSGEEDQYEKVRQIEYTGITREYSPQQFQLQNLATNMWKEGLGLNITLNPKQYSVNAEQFINHEYDILQIKIEARPERLDPWGILTYFDPDKSDPGEYNTTEYQSEELNDALEKVETLNDREERKEWVYKAQELMAQAQPLMFVYHANKLSAADGRAFGNYQPRIGGMPFWNVFSLSQMEQKTDESTFILGHTRDIQTLNTLNLRGTSSVRALLLNYDPLVRIDLDGTPRPAAAADWDIVDTTTVDVTLRDGMTFHDGEPVTPEDVKFTFDYIMDWDVTYLRSYYNPIDNVELRGDNVIRFNLKNPNAPFVQITLNQIWILPKHIWENVVEEKGFEHPKEWAKEEVDLTGSGPYRMTEYESENRAIYEKFDDYYMDFPVDRLIWKVYGSQTTAIGDLEEGRIHNVRGLQASQYERTKQNNNLVSFAVPSHGLTPIYIQNSREPFGDINVRHAMAHCLDKQEIINVALQGYGDIATSPIAPANEFWHNPDVPKYEGGAETGRQILYDAGYRWNSNQQLLKPV